MPSQNSIELRPTETQETVTKSDSYKLPGFVQIEWTVV